MKKYLKYIDGTSDKFWQIEAQGLEFTVTYGKNGTSGTSQTKSFNTAAECLKLAEKLVAEKIKKGYSETGEVVVDSTTKVGKAKTALQEVTAEYDNLIAEKRLMDLLPFLQTKVKGNVTEFKKHLKRCKKYWTDYVDLSKEPRFKFHLHSEWGRRGDVIQVKIINLTAIALVDKTEINAFDGVISYLEEIQTDTVVREIIFWARPNWISEFLLTNIKSNEWWSINYATLRYLESEKLCNFNEELFALNLAQFNEYKLKKSARNFINDLLQDPVTINRDVPLLFEYPSSVNTIYFRENESQQYNQFKLWKVVFEELLRDNLIARPFVIEKCLLIQTKEWNNGAKGFFKQVLLDLKPTADELIANQQTIFSFLQNAYPPIITLGVDFVKTISEHQKFKSQDFLEWVAPVFYREDAKGSIKKIFSVFDKMVKANPKLGKKCSQIMADVFVIPDLTLQEKAAKFILKQATKKDSELQDKLQMYSSQMQGTVRKDLETLLGNTANEGEMEAEEAYTYSPIVAPKLMYPVVLPADWNAILFQFGKFIKSEELLDAEVLLHTLFVQHDLLPEDFVKQLQPYSKQLEKSYFDNEIKNYIKAFLIQKLHNWNHKIEVKYSGYQQIKLPSLFKSILFLIDQKINVKSKLPLLSFPTHYPHWVEAKTLLERLIAYQNAEEAIDYNDLALAIARMPKENSEEAISLLPQLDVEIRNLFEFCFGLHQEIKIPKTGLLNKLLQTAGSETVQSKITAIWAVAAQTFYPETTFEAFEKTVIAGVPFAGTPFKNPVYFKERCNEWKDYHTKETMRHCWIELHVDVPKYKKIPNHLLYSLDSYYTGENKWHYMLYGEGIVHYWNSIMPQNNEPLALKLLTTHCVNTSESSVVLKAFLHLINRPDFEFTQYSTVVFACCFFMDKKEVRLLAAEVLYEKIANQSLPIAAFCSAISQLIANNYGVFGRFADALLSSKDSSPLHNQALFLIMDAVIGTLGKVAKLPTNFKKFIENYYDLVTKLNKKPSEDTLIFLKTLENNASLKKLIKVLVN